MTYSLVKLADLYDQDYCQWVEMTIQELRSQNFEAIDWENLIEEVSDLSRRERQKLASLLTRLLEHLLKLAYWTRENEQNAPHWQAEIRNFRKQIKRQFLASPSLKPYLNEIFEECYQDAREIFCDRSQLALESIPILPFLTIEETLNPDWLPLAMA